MSRGTIKNGFKNKKVLIMGLGLHGGGVAVANWFLKQGARVRITDLKTREELLSSLKKIREMDSRLRGNDRRRRKNIIQYTLGKHDKKDFLWADIVVQNPGVPRESKFLKIAQAHGAEIENEATLFFKIIGRERIIGVTGTRGKSTTSALIYAIIKEKFPCATFGGNIATSPMLSIIPKAKRTREPVVLELSSWHLENLGEKKLSPRIAVFTNLYPDHLNRYKDIIDYGLAKQNIFKNQGKDDFIVLNWDNFYTLSFSKSAKSKIFWFSKSENAEQPTVYIKSSDIYFRHDGLEEKVMPLSGIRILGAHNWENALAAICVAKILKIDNDVIVSAIKKFKGLEHRLEFVREIGGVQYINDTAATTPDGTMAALRTVTKDKGQETRDKNVILIAGGSDKGIGQEKFNELGELIHKHCKAVILFSGEGSKKIDKALRITHYALRVTGTLTMPDALGLAKSMSQKGDIILLSPACASFGLFVNEFDRGNQFKKIVKEI